MYAKFRCILIVSLNTLWKLKVIIFILRRPFTSTTVTRNSEPIMGYYYTTQSFGELGT
jgi:hypothetical protein